MGSGVFFPANPDLADILGDTDFDFENLCFFDFLDPGFPDFHVPRFPDSQTEAWARPGPDLGLGHGPARDSWHTVPRQLRGSSATTPDHKVGEIQGTRTMP